MLNIILFLLVVTLGYTAILLIAKSIEKFRQIKGNELNYKKQSKVNAVYFMIFGILLLLSIPFSFYYFKFSFIGKPASDVGIDINRIFITTTVITLVVFYITHMALFLFVLKYRESKNRKAKFFSHSNTLEIIWTSVPALALTLLVVMGLNTWFKVFPNPKKDKTKYSYIEVTGKQFNWIVRYPGPDGILGKRLITKDNITPENEIGVDWSDPYSHDDFYSSEIHMVKGMPVYFNLSALDVLHSFYLPHFRLKMDCVPGIPTGIGFTPIKTTEEHKKEIMTKPYWQQIDPNTGEPRYKGFNYELACAELCGKSHYGMQMNVIVETQDEFNKWAASKQPHYLSLEKKSDEIVAPKEFNFDNLDKNLDTSAVYATDAIVFESNSITLNAKSISTLDQLVLLLNHHTNVHLELSAHTDADGDDKSNQKLSDARALACMKYIISKGIDASRVSAHGYGESRPIADNNTPEGKQKNRRTEFKFN